MSFSCDGIDTLEYEVTNIQKNGFWFLVDDDEYFVSFRDFPEFADATVKQICNVRRLDKEQFCWDALDVDLDIGSIKKPSDFPLRFSK